MNEREDGKKAAALKALEWVQDGMRIGLGSGTTSRHFIQHLSRLCKEGLKVSAIASSTESENLAKQGGIPLLDVHAIDTLDLTVDGADEIDSQKRLIKGRGGALLREKIIASMSKQFIIIADPSKQVEKLGKQPLPVEILPFGANATKKKIEKLGCSASLRRKPDGSIYITDNHNWILDLQFPHPFIHPEQVNEQLIEIPGILETGFFFDLAPIIIIGDINSVSVID